MTKQDYQAQPDLLKDRIILVTGAGSGIGKTAAETFAQYGATVILAGKTVAKLEATYDAIVQQGGPQPAIYPINLEGATPDDYAEMADIIQTNFGRLDGLLNNAGILGPLTPIQQYNIEQWYKVMQVNVNAQFLLTQACLPLLRQSDDASILFTGSGVGRKGRAYWGAYAVSKFATEGLMQTLADELDNTNIRCNSINPGKTRTRMRATAYPAEDPETLLTPEQIMPTYLYLMGPESHGITGQAWTAQ